MALIFLITYGTIDIMEKQIETPRYVLVGYEKDGDVYEDVASGNDPDRLKARAEILVARHARCEPTEQPFDWFEILDSASPDATPVAVIA